MPSTDLDLTAAVDAAAYAAHEAAVKAHTGPDAPYAWHELSNAQRFEWREHVLPIVTAAAPLIAGQALDLEAARVPDHDAGPYLIDRACDYYQEAGQ